MGQQLSKEEKRARFFSRIRSAVHRQTRAHRKKRKLDLFRKYPHRRLEEY
jgi:hypothetical protein